MLDIEQPVTSAALPVLVDPSTENPHPAEELGIVDRIEARPPSIRVRARAAVQRIVAGFRYHIHRPRAARNHIVARAAGQAVIGGRVSWSSGAAHDPSMAISGHPRHRQLILRLPSSDTGRHWRWRCNHRRARRHRRSRRPALPRIASSPAPPRWYRPRCRRPKGVVTPNHQHLDAGRTSPRASLPAAGTAIKANRHPAPAPRIAGGVDPLRRPPISPSPAGQHIIAAAARQRIRPRAARQGVAAAATNQRRGIAPRSAGHQRALPTTRSTLNSVSPRHRRHGQPARQG